jgi:hypothetical protein
MQALAGRSTDQLSVVPDVPEVHIYERGYSMKRNHEMYASFLQAVKSADYSRVRKLLPELMDETSVLAEAMLCAVELGHAQVCILFIHQYSIKLIFCVVTCLLVYMSLTSSPSVSLSLSVCLSVSLCLSVCLSL